MESIYSETIHSIANDLDHLWRDKNAFSSVKSPDSVSIEDGNFCSYKRFMLSTASGNTNGINNQNAKASKDWRLAANQSMSLLDRLAKTASIWTQPGISRIQADNILKEFQPGIFIVRMNSDQKTMVLSYRMEEKSQHVMIKVDVKKGFYMDGSQNVFRNVNCMIEYYMKHPLINSSKEKIQNPDLHLKLPRALLEAHEAVHFQFFENMKINFWTTLLANKSITDIWGKSATEVKVPENTSDADTDCCPPLPPREYQLSEFHLLQGLADVFDGNEEYQVVPKKGLKKAPPLPPPKEFPSLSRSMKTTETTERLYSQIWQWQSENNLGPREQGKIPNSTETIYDEMKLKPTVAPKPRQNLNIPGTLPKPNEIIEAGNTDACFTIQKIIEKYYPQIIHFDIKIKDSSSSVPLLSDKILHHKPTPPNITAEKPAKELENTQSDDLAQYETPWDVKNTMLSQFIDYDKGHLDSQKNDAKNECSDERLGLQDKNTSLPVTNSKFYSNSNEEMRKLPDNYDSSGSTDTNEEEGNLPEEESRLQMEFLGEIETVIISPTPNSPIYSSNKFQYGQSIRKFLTRLCTRRGKSEISKSVKLFISCTMDRSDLSPYTTMRLIRQFMSGLKNLITKNKDEFSLNTIINEEVLNTPKNVFINFDTIIESVLTKSVIKPLKVHVYKLLILEHYKNNNLKLIADGVEACKCTSAEKLGLKENAKSIIESKINSIRGKFQLISKQYSPEKKIKYMISIVEIVFNMIKQIYPGTDNDSMQNVIKSDSILPLFVYIFSLCKLDAVATQCEVEYIEGLIWSSKLVNGEPGFFLLNLMSALEAIKVMSRSALEGVDLIDLSDKSPVRIDNSIFFTKIHPSSLTNASCGSVNVIILDEKINRLVAKTFPVRSTLTVNSLCSTIAYRLGIFNPSEYSLFKYTGFDESLLNDFDFPLLIKQSHQQKTGENVNFLFKRKNANFILPCDISVR